MTQYKRAYLDSAKFRPKHRVLQQLLAVVARATILSDSPKKPVRRGRSPKRLMNLALSSYALRFLLLLTLVQAPSALGQTVLFKDAMESGAGWKYSHFGGTSKPTASDISQADFGFDYSTLGIPEAPHSQVGDATRRGLRLAANTPGLWGGDQVAAVYEDVNFDGQYTVQVDAWLNWSSGGSNVGTTEHLGVLAGFQVADAQQSFAPGQNGAGALVSSDGDASCGSGICDYILVKDGAHLDSASGQYGEDNFGFGNRLGYNSTDSNANLNLPALFPSFNIATATDGLNGTGTQPAGALGFQWVTVTLKVDTLAVGANANGKLGTVEVTLTSHHSGNSFVLGTIDNSVEDDPFDGYDTQERPANLSGGIGLMLTDFYNSGPSNPNRAFALFDNLRISDGLVSSVTDNSVGVPEPHAIVTSMWCLLILGYLRVRRPRKWMAPHRTIGTVGLFLLMLVPTSPALAVLGLTGNFDSGSLQSWSGNLTQIQLTGRETYPGSAGWRWLYFEASGVNASQPQFAINQAFAGGNSALTNHKMVYSYDQQNWHFFDNNQRSGNLFSFSNDSPFAQDTVYVAYAQPFSYQRMVDHTAAMLATPWAAPTLSGDARGIIGQTPIAFDDLGRLNPARDIYAYRITNPATDSATVPKHKVMVTSGLHAGEVLGNYALEGLLNWLTSADPRTARLRNEAEFFVYPMLNAAGRFAGTSRATVENPSQDPNGLWHPTRWTTHQDIRVAGEAMIADSQSTPGIGLDAFVDFHSTIPSSPGDDFGFIEISEGDHLAPFWQKFLSLQPNAQQVESTGTSWTSANFADIVLGADVDITFETQFGMSRPITYYHDLGKNFGIGFYTDFVPQVDGDYNGDGVVDAADFTVWRDTLGLEGDLRADGDNNGTIDGDDYIVWSTHFGAVAGSSQATTTAIPEPSAITLMLILSSMGLRFRIAPRFVVNFRPQ